MRLTGLPTAFALSRLKSPLLAPFVCIHLYMYILLYAHISLFCFCCIFFRIVCVFFPHFRCAPLLFSDFSSSPICCCTLPLCRLNANARIIYKYNTQQQYSPSTSSTCTSPFLFAFAWNTLSCRRGLVRTL